MIISIIVAMAKNRVIGNKGIIPWRIPEDTKRFKEITMGHPVIMGRKTYESIPEKYRPLPGRKNIILTNGENSYDGCLMVNSIEHAMYEAGRETEEAFVLGGAAVYEAFLPFADRIYLTQIESDFEGDVFFPEINLEKWKMDKSAEMRQCNHSRLFYSFQLFRRRT